MAQDSINKVCDDDQSLSNHQNKSDSLDIKVGFDIKAILSICDAIYLYLLCNLSIIAQFTLLI
ncbi:hypothetical protein E9M_00536 [Moraxella catarrhalis 46P47B1]|nr:hypothetical protein MCR_0653 [Moraxella catarrhalis BBH18]AZQ95233.1 hypothetical protein EJK48_0699 [Moraxella catarrhalis]EGE11474.1 hypothetical protein E9G_04669 [Moraxella catarrhalis 7169]EGE14993.1 hypothetical protein E9M_00536 [Moraxella catarrhalis 46P47B1]OFN30240.1 hypothetical protein HMPREF2573_04555 [Moraxella sp. HMSC061H09]